MNKTITTAARVLTFCTALAAGSQAHSAGLSSSQSMTNDSLRYVVQYGDLDLSKSGGAAALYARLREAAIEVCRPLESRELGMAQKHRACFDKAVANAVADINRPMVSQYHQMRTKSGVGTVQLARAN